MKYRLLGKSGLRVSEAALGTMTFGDDWGWGSPKAEAQKVYETYREAGGNFIDRRISTPTARAKDFFAISFSAIARALSYPRNTPTTPSVPREQSDVALQDLKVTENKSQLRSRPNSKGAGKRLLRCGG